VVAGLLHLRYGLRGGLLTVAPPIAAALVSLGVLGWLGQPVSLFNVMALLLVLGLGVDYALFFRETGIDDDTTILAIALSAITTILAFGLLAFSATTAIHAFGLTITIGITAAFLLAPLAGVGARRA
jgi:predicted exporter